MLSAGQASARRACGATEVFRIPELLRLIASFNTVIRPPARGSLGLSVDRSDLVRLSQVCRRTFEILVPDVWKNVNGAQHLLALIKSTSFRYDDSTGELKEVILRDKLGSAARKMFRRFDIYAPHVQVLNIYSSRDHGYAVSGWQLLKALAKRRTLLPGLRSIALACHSSHYQSRDQIQWITCFASFATVDVRILSCCSPSDDLELPSSAPSEFLETLAACSPNLEVLILRPHGLHSCDELSDQEEDVLYDPWYYNINVFQELAWLSVSEDWLYAPSLLELGQLPKLASLELWPGSLIGFDPQHDLLPVLPSGSFPALRCLTLKDLHPHVITEVLSLRGMLENITHLRIDLEAKELDEDVHPGLLEQLRVLYRNNWIVRKFLPLLQNTPCLEHLSVEFVPPEEVIYHIGSPTVLDVMAKLPLRTVHLNQMHLGSGVLDLDLGTIWPNVTKLTMPDQHASLQELSYFAAMPKLRHLTISVDFTTKFTPQNTPIQRFSLRTLESSIGSTIKSDSETMEHNARVLTQLWPNVRFKTSPGEDEAWNSLVKLFDHLIQLHHVMERHEVQEDRELAKKMLWDFRVETASGYTSVDYVYEG